MGTKTEEELEAARVLVAQLEAKKQAEDEAKARASRAVRELAVATHGILCEDEHPAGCGWNRDITADEPDAADWTQADHQLWLDRVLSMLGWMAGRGWTLIPPGASEPLSDTSGTIS